MNIVFLYVSFFFGLWDLRSPTKDPTHTSCNQSRVLTTRFQQNSLLESFFTSQHILVYYLTISKVCFFWCGSFFKSFYWICYNIYIYGCAQSCLTLWDPMDWSPSGSSICGISQARILEWVAISCSRGSSRSRDRTYISCVTCIGRWVLYHCTIWGNICYNIISVLCSGWEACGTKIEPASAASEGEVLTTGPSWKPLLLNFWECFKN